MVVANAGIEGIFGGKPLTEYPDDLMHQMNAINQFGVIATLKRAVPFFRKNGGGDFVISGSIGTMSTQRGFELAANSLPPDVDLFSSFIPYLATKAGVDLVTRLAAGVYARDNIKVYNGAWGPTYSEMQDRIEGETFGKEGLAGFNPLFKHTKGDPESCAKFVLAIADGSSNFKSGDILVSDHDSLVHAKAFYDVFYGGGSDTNNGWPVFNDLKNSTFDYKGDLYDFDNSPTYQAFLKSQAEAAAKEEL